MRRLLIVAILVSLVVGIGVGYVFSYGVISGPQSEVSSLESGISTLTTDYHTLNTTYNQLLTNYSNLKTMYNQLQTACNGLNETCNELVEDYDSLESEYNILNSTHHDLQIAYEGLEEAYESLNGTYHSLNSIYNDLQSDYEEALDRIAELEQMVEYEVDVLLDQEYYYSVKNDLENANDTILVAMYSMVYDPDDMSDWANDLIRELVYAKDRGVNVTVAIENRTYFDYMSGNLEAFDYLSSNGVSVQLDQDTETDHMKFVVIDNHIVYVGSHNWSESGLYHNRETSVEIVSEGIADIFKAYFETIICPVC